VAAQRNQPLEIHRLVKAEGVSASHSNPVGQSALHVASLWGHVQAVKALLDLGAPVNAQNNLTGATPLHMTVSSSKEPVENRIECARMLVAAGADTDLPDHGYGSRTGRTPLDVLEDDVENGIVGDDDDNTKSFRLVLSGGGGAAAERSAIFDLVDNVDVDGIRTMLSNRGDGSGVDDNATANLSERDNATGLTPLQYALEKLLSLDVAGTADQTQEGLVSILLSMLRNGADPNAELKRRRKRRDHEMQADDGSDMPLHTVCLALSLAYSSSSDSSHSLERVASAMVKEGGARPGQPTILLLHDACRRGNLSTVQFLIDSIGIDPNIPGRQGLTGLHFASRSGRTDIVEWLLSYEKDGYRAVDVTIVDDRGKTALDAARVNEKADVVALLETAKERSD